MSLPPGFLDELRTRTSLAQVAGRKVIWDPRKSNQGKGDLWAPCPFHQEKTASFHVDDRKGFYYCFGCHAKGDAISFVRETENMGFMEAVEVLAREAGMTMPARDPKAQAKADRSAVLAEVMEQAVQFYRLQLKTGVAGPARAYLDGRGLSQTALDRWEIGFAPNERQALFQHLTAKSVPAKDIIDAGLAAEPDDGGAPYDRFRGRILFPIRDARGRAIALGGRAMDPNARAKYLNSPETLLFDKSRSLYNVGPAREAAGKGQALVVAEGYMDVIALAEAGFGAAVAPLGTAVTEHQLAMLWRIAPEPIIALDGDTAGLRAAMRVIDLVLPMLAAGRSVRFALMPPGQDPDDVIRAGGAEAMGTLLDQAQPLVQLLWQRETEGHVFDSPERRAALDKRLFEATKRIPDAVLRQHYNDEIKRLRWDLFRGGRAKPPNQAGRGPYQRDGGRKSAPEGATPGARASALARNGLAEAELREALVLAVLVVHPDLVMEFEDALEALDCETPLHGRLRAVLLRHSGVAPDATQRAVVAEIGADTLEKLVGQSHVRLVPAIRNPKDIETARQCLTEEVAKLAARRGHLREVSDAAEEIAAPTQPDEGLTWRLGEAARTLNEAEHGAREDRTQYDIAPSGARMNKEERDRLDAMIAQALSAKPGRPTH
ncbi:MAG: DNA primase [Pseudomonadota bacterium]